MKYELLETGLQVTPEGEKDRITLAQRVFRLDFSAAMQFVQAGDVPSLLANGEENKWFEAASSGGWELLKPFVEVVRGFSGVADWLPKVSDEAILRPEPSDYEVITSVRLSRGDEDTLIVYVAGYQKARAWNGHRAERLAEKYFSSAAIALFACGWGEREYIPCNGYNDGSLLKRNPYYPGNGSLYLPYGVWPNTGRPMNCYGGDIRHHWFMPVLFRLWEEQTASETQKKVLAAYRRLEEDNRCRGVPWQEYTHMYCWPEEDLRSLGKRCQNWKKGLDPVIVTLDTFRGLR